MIVRYRKGWLVQVCDTVETVEFDRRPTAWLPFSIANPFIDFPDEIPMEKIVNSNMWKFYKPKKINKYEFFSAVTTRLSWT